METILKPKLRAKAVRNLEKTHHRYVSRFVKSRVSIKEKCQIWKNRSETLLLVLIVRKGTIVRKNNALFKNNVWLKTFGHLSPIIYRLWPPMHKTTFLSQKRYKNEDGNLNDFVQKNQNFFQNFRKCETFKWSKVTLYGYQTKFYKNVLKIKIRKFRFLSLFWTCKWSLKKSRFLHPVIVIDIWWICINFCLLTGK